MDIEKVRALAEILSTFELSSITITEGETKISLKKETNIFSVPMQSVPQIQQNNKNISNINSDDSASVVDTLYNFSDVNEIKSPLVGTFYSAPSPEAKPFVEVGAKVKKGDTLCIVEAMKLMNEITADKDCEIVDICVKNGEIVEYGQTLFKVI